MVLVVGVQGWGKMVRVSSLSTSVHPEYCWGPLSIPLLPLRDTGCHHKVQWGPRYTTNSTAERCNLTPTWGAGREGRDAIQGRSSATV